MSLATSVSCLTASTKLAVLDGDHQTPLNPTSSHHTASSLFITMLRLQRNQLQRRFLERILVCSLSTTTNYTAPTKAGGASVPINEQDIISQLTPLKKILCLCPVPLGRGRVSWSGGDSSEGETTHMNFQSQPKMQKITQMQPLKVTKYRYGERYVIGAAVSDAYLTHAVPVRLDKAGLNSYVAEMVPTFRCDGKQVSSYIRRAVVSIKLVLIYLWTSLTSFVTAHNLGPAPICYTNLPYFRHELLKDIGHFDIGAVVIATPMKPETNPFHPAPSRMQLEQERKLEAVRDSIMGVLLNYVSQEEDDDDFNDATPIISDATRNKKQQRLLGLQGRIDHRLSIAEVLSKSYDSHHGSWGHITQALRRLQNKHTLGGCDSNYFAGNQVYGSQNAYTSVPPEIHAAVGLNAMMEKYASGFHNSFF